MGRNLERYHDFLIGKVKFTQRQLGEVGGYDRYKAYLHDNAASEVMEETGSDDYFSARKEVTKIMQEWINCDEENNF